MKVNIGTRAISMSRLAQICGGMLYCIGGESDQDVQFESICTDSRESAAQAQCAGRWPDWHYGDVHRCGLF